MYQESENDYVLLKGTSVWITVGDKSVYIANDVVNLRTGKPQGKKLEVFYLGEEEDEPLYDCSLEPEFYDIAPGDSIWIDDKESNYGGWNIVKQITFRDDNTFEMINDADEKITAHIKTITGHTHVTG